MLHILFLPGTFGSTIYYIIDQYSDHSMSQIGQSLTEDKLILPDGSMHSFYKPEHHNNKESLLNFFSRINNDDSIKLSTPAYPMYDCKTVELINLFSQHRPNDQVIFVYVDDLEYAELNMLAQYYKMVIGSLQMSIGTIFCGNNTENIVQWNSKYTHWSQMKHWELREWFSIFYPTWVSEWVNPKDTVPTNWLKISTREILNDTFSTFKKIINYAGNQTKDDEKLISFSNLWRSKQQYLIDEYNLLNDIVMAIINKKHLQWQKLNIISEAIIQQKLRSQGYEIKCFNLDTLPTDSDRFAQLLEKI